VLEASPLLLPAVLAGFSVVAMALLQLGLFRPLLVLPLGLAGAAVAARGVALTRPEPLAGPRWLDAAALLVALGFATVNASYAAENLNVFRDPATYTITGRWLERHGSLPIPVHPEVFGAAGDVSFSSLGFDAATPPGFVNSQFGNLLPGLLAVGGWLGGDRLLLRVNVLLGAAALLALYGLARQHAGRGWALVATAALGVSLPLLYFSRNPYSEPVTLLFLAGGLALLREAQRRDKTLAYGLAGLVLGSAVLARVDGLLFLLAVPMFASVALAAAPAERRRRVAGQVGALLLGVVVPAGVAVANLVNLSPVYLDHLGGEIRMVAAAGIAVTVLGVVAVAVAWRTTLLHGIAAATARWLPAAGAAAVLVLAAVGASRPLWYVGHTQHPDPSQLDYIAFLQKAQRLPIEPDRTYAEQTLAWISWYWGPVTVALAVLGAAVGVYRLLQRGDLLLVAPLGMFLSTALAYLAVANAVPDQVNVMRRYLPVVIPGVLVAAAAALGLLARRSRAATAVAVALAVVMVLFPAGVSARVATVRDGVPQLAEVRNLCGNLPADAALVAAGSLAITYQQTFRSWCDGVPVAGVAERLTASRLRRVAASATAHDRRLHVVVMDPRELPGDAGAAAEWQPISCIRASHLNAVLEHPPDAWGADQRTIYLGVVTSQGAVIPAPRSQSPLLAC
jgi:Dolichyl-phosphate-mannose-protein mannosyltransferase